MHDEVYSDGIGEITVSGTIVRVDLVTLSHTDRANGGPKSIFRQRLIFSVEGFANSVALMQKALQGLVETGVVQRAGQIEERPSPENHKPVNSSPNFQ
jgi:hypothetical protein